MKKLICVLIYFFSFSSEAQQGTDPLALSIAKRVEQTVESEAAPHIHARRAPGESVESARMKINGWIRFNFERALGYRSRGDKEAALFHFFMARHTLRDSASPISNDENGDPAIIDSKHAIEHRDSASHVWRDRIDEDMQLMFDQQYVPGGDLLKMYGIDSEKGPVDRPGQTLRPKIAGAN